MISPYYQFDGLTDFDDDEEDRRPSILGSMAIGAGLGAVGGMGVAGAHGAYTGAQEWKNVHAPKHQRLDTASQLDADAHDRRVDGVELAAPTSLEQHDARRLQATIPPSVRQRLKTELPQAKSDVQWKNTQLGRGALWGGVAGGATGLLMALLRRS